jgi:hypothetical protein
MRFRLLLITKASAIFVAGFFLSAGLALLTGRGSGAVATGAVGFGSILSVAGVTAWVRRAARRTFSPAEARAMTRAFRLLPLWIFPSILLGDLGGGALSNLGPPVFGLIGAVLGMILSLATLSSLTAGFALWITRQEDLLFPER